MEVTEHSSALDTSTAAPEVTSTPDVSSPPPTEPSLSEKISALGEKGDSGADKTVAAPYQPNLKFVAGKKEHSLPDYLATVITDDKREKELKEVWEKAQGIDFVKQERAKVQEEYKSFKSQAEPLFGIAQKIDFHRQRGDVVGMAQQIGITPQQLMQAAIQFAERENLPPDQKAVYHQHQQEATRAYELEQRLQAQQNQYTELVRRQTVSDVENTLSSPEIAPIVQSFDQRNGEGAFFEKLVTMGQIHHMRTGQDMSARELASKLINEFGLSAMTQQQTTQPQVNQSVNQRGTGKLPVIPNTGSGQVSPASRSPRSIEDLKKIAREKFAE